MPLPSGDYTLEYSRGPEYLVGRTSFRVGTDPETVLIRLRRWVDPAARHWWSGDHHIHAAGCAHYTNPSEGVHAPDMLRQILGEDLKVGCNLTWGPCFDYQKQFFTGRDDAVSAYLPEEPCPTPDRRGLSSWNIEFARLPGTRRVKVELVVNARAVAAKEIVADGSLHEITFDGVRIDRSSWVALRVPRSSHTNPVFVIVAGRPIRASRESARWCLDGVEQCWKSKESTYRAEELADARAAYDHARGEYRRILAECEID